MKTALLIFVFIVAFIPVALAGSPYDFDDRDRNHMRGAFMMCATTGFISGDCPSVLKKCWQPPMIYWVKHRHHYHIKSFCVDAPDFFISSTDQEQILADAMRIANEGGMSVESLQSAGIELE